MRNLKHEDTKENIIYALGTGTQSYPGRSGPRTRPKLTINMEQIKQKRNGEN